MNGRLRASDEVLGGVGRSDGRCGGWGGRILGKGVTLPRGGAAGVRYILFIFRISFVRGLERLAEGLCDGVRGRAGMSHGVMCPCCGMLPNGRPVGWRGRGDWDGDLGELRGLGGWGKRQRRTATAD